MNITLLNNSVNMNHRDHIWCKIAAISGLYDSQIRLLRYDPDMLRKRNMLSHQIPVNPAMSYYYEMIKDFVSVNLFEKIDIPKTFPDDNTRHWIGFKITGLDIYEMHFYFDGMDDEPFDQFDERKTTIIDLFYKYGSSFIEKLAHKIGWSTVMILIVKT